VADPADEKVTGGDWSEFRDGKAVEGEAKSRDRDVAPRAIIALLALLFAIIFVAQNGKRVSTRFLFFDSHPRLWVVIVVSLLLGALLGQAAGLVLRRRKKS
jgi:uncharacterized integral membrane protein